LGYDFDDNFRCDCGFDDRKDDRKYERFEDGFDGKDSEKKEDLRWNKCCSPCFSFRCCQKPEPKPCCRCCCNCCRPKPFCVTYVCKPICK
jgi:hypothetical protein